MSLYLVELCQPVPAVASQQHLWSATWQLLVVPRHWLSFYGRRASCVAGPSVWYSLPDSLWNPVIGGNSFRQSLKTFLFAMHWCIQRIRGFMTMHYMNWLFTYLLTWLLITTILQFGCPMPNKHYVCSEGTDSDWIELIQKKNHKLHSVTFYVFSLADIIHIFSVDIRFGLMVTHWPQSM